MSGRSDQAHLDIGDAVSPSVSRPIRTCVGCRQRATQDQLIRLVWSDQHQAVVVDRRQRLPGRGAWLHPTNHCRDLALRRRAIGRALRRSGGVVDWSNWPVTDPTQ
ncbi:MAG: YlxR family protein [Propionibacteriaceae bacterium]|nr:YlxR family protein [Propionibacteriaceae bacterium]